MIRRPPRSTRTDTLFPYTTLFRSTTVDGLVTGDADPLEIDAAQCLVLAHGSSLPDRDGERTGRTPPCIRPVAAQWWRRHARNLRKESTCSPSPRTPARLSRKSPTRPRRLPGSGSPVMPKRRSEENTSELP